MTRKAIALLGLAFMLYFFANQTQVGWLYVIAALLVGLVLTARYFNRRMLRDIHITREIDADTAVLWENDEITIQLNVSSERPSYQLMLQETSPVADPESDQHEQKHFFPQVGEQATPVSYTTQLYRRGLHTFPAVRLATRAPFGFFQQKQQVTEPQTRLLVYPEVRPLDRFTLFEQRPSVQMSRQRAGLGNEVMGVRPYRVGDSPRHIHWRSVARTGQLISKEFVDETQPGLAIALDQTALQDDALQALYEATKHNPFETAVKIAASLSQYALDHGYPLYFVGETAPRGALTADSLWQYLAKIEPNAERPFNEHLAQVTQTFLAVILPYPTETAVSNLLSLAQRGHALRVYLLDVQTFPNHTPPTDITTLTDQLKANRIDVRVIGYGEDWED